MTTIDREHNFVLTLTDIFPRHTVNLGYPWTGEPLTEAQLDAAVTAAAVAYSTTDALDAARCHVLSSEAVSIAAYALHYSGIESLLVTSSTAARGWRVYPDTGECTPVRVIKCTTFLQGVNDQATFDLDIPAHKTFSLSDAIDAAALAFVACTPAAVDAYGYLESREPYIGVRPNFTAVDLYPGYYRKFRVGIPTRLYRSGRVEVDLEEGGIAQAVYEDGHTKSMLW